ncbi:hypothetical protein V6000_008910 [Aspergillus fumigatus]
MAVSRDLEAPTVVNDPTADDAVVEKKEYADGTPANDPFGNEECGEVKYRVMSWCLSIDVPNHGHTER